VDITSVQNLIDVRNQLDRHASPETVEWHFASISNRWTKRALVSAGFGTPTLAHAVGETHRWKPIFDVAEIGGSSSAANQAEWDNNRAELRSASVKNADIERAQSVSNSSDENLKSRHHVSTSSKQILVNGVNKPLFHVDLTAALHSAIANLENRPKLDPEEAAVQEEAVRAASVSH
jgi:sodium-independent sulfate anion transporter 11